MSGKKLAIIGNRLDKEFEGLLGEYSVSNLSIEQWNEKRDQFDLVFIEEEDCARISLNDAYFVVVTDRDQIPLSVVEKRTNDLITLPISKPDLFRIFMRFNESSTEMDQFVPGLASKVEDHLKRVQKIQKRLIKNKFDPIGGLHISSKYWSGLKAGGDYFDVFDLADKNYVGIIMIDSSTYNISNFLIRAIMQLSSGKENLNPEEPAKAIEKLLNAVREHMGDKDRFSAFVAFMNKKTYQMKMATSGTFYLAKLMKENQGPFDWILSGTYKPIEKETIKIYENTINLHQGDRLILASDGWKQCLDGMDKFSQVLANSSLTPIEMISEFGFHLRQETEKVLEPSEEDELFMPMEDCSILVFELAQNTLRLA
ncbi:MAG: hypothetical protein M9962_01330 [Oligoflexia bacterium]|nr:hypothetical protein [Oligoflexia bacterium]